MSLREVCKDSSAHDGSKQLESVQYSISISGISLAHNKWDSWFFPMAQKSGSTGDRMPLKEICVLVPAGTILENDSSSMSSITSIRALIYPRLSFLLQSCPFFLLSSHFHPSHLLPGLGRHTDVRTHTPLIYFDTNGTKGRKFQYIHRHPKQSNNNSSRVTQSQGAQGHSEALLLCFCSLECFSLVFKSRGDCSLLCLRC